MLMPHILAHLRSRIDQITLLDRKYQCLGAMLLDIVLPVSVEHVLIMLYFYYHSIGKMSYYLISLLPVQRVIKNLFLDIYM